jgi:hypothetical protein
MREKKMKEKGDRSGKGAREKQTMANLRRLFKNSGKGLIASSYPSVICAHGTIPVLRDGFSRNLIFCIFSCENSSFIKN